MIKHIIWEEKDSLIVTSMLDLLHDSALCRAWNLPLGNMEFEHQDMYSEFTHEETDPRPLSRQQLQCQEAQLQVLPEFYSGAWFPFVNRLIFLFFIQTTPSFLVFPIMPHFHTLCRGCCCFCSCAKRMFFSLSLIAASWTRLRFLLQLFRRVRSPVQTL